MESYEGVDLGKRHVLKAGLQFGEQTLLIEVTVFRGDKLSRLRSEVAHEWRKKQPVRDFMKRGLDLMASEKTFMIIVASFLHIVLLFYYP